MGTVDMEWPLPAPSPSHFPSPTALPQGTWRLQYSSTMYTWSRSAKCPWKATMLRCRRWLCRAISRSTCGHGLHVCTPAGGRAPRAHTPGFMSTGVHSPHTHKGQEPLWGPALGVGLLGMWMGACTFPPGGSRPAPPPPRGTTLRAKTALVDMSVSL